VVADALARHGHNLADALIDLSNRINCSLAIYH